MSQISLQENDAKLDGIEANANNYSHPTGNGNNHIPSGGASGQFLGYSSAGTASWVASPSPSMTFGAVGTYVWAHNTGNTLTHNSTWSGSNLTVIAAVTGSPNGDIYTYNTTKPSISGTWRAIGGGDDTRGSHHRMLTLFIRIS